MEQAVESGRPRPRILLLVPHRVRDLEGSALLSYHLDRAHGVDTFVCNLADFESRLLELAPDAMVIEYLGWASKARQAELAHRLGVQVVCLPVAGLWETEEEHLRAAGQGTGGNRFVDAYLAWGDLNRRIVVGAGLIPAARAFVTGCPRFDFYHPPYLSLDGGGSDLRQELGIGPGEPMILWATSTPNFARDPRVMMREAVQINRLSQARAETSLREERMQFEQNSALVAELARRNPAWHFVVKIHPIEPVSSYQALASAAPNLRLAYASAIRRYLEACDVLLQRSCTTAMEAWMLGKPVIELPVEGSGRGWAPPEFLAGNRSVRNVDEAEEQIRGYLSGRPIRDSELRARDRFLTDCFGPQDGRAAERCAERIASLVCARTETDRASTRGAASAVVDERRRTAQGRLSARLKRALFIPQTVPLRFWRLLRRPAGAPRTADRVVTQEMVSDLQARLRQLCTSANSEPIARR